GRAVVGARVERAARRGGGRWARQSSHTLQHSIHPAFERAPAGSGLLERRLAETAQAVDTAAAAGMLRPGAIEEPIPLQAMERRIDGALAAVKETTAAVAEPLDDLIAVSAAAGDRRQQQRF